MCTPENGVHTIEMMTYDWSMIAAYVLMFSCCDLITNYECTICVAFSHVYFRCQKFSFQTHMVQMKNLRQKMRSIYGASFWSMCHGYKMFLYSGPQVIKLLCVYCVGGGEHSGGDRCSQGV